MINTKISSEQLGIAGEYLVAAELTRRGFIASITLRNSEGIDILCSTTDAKMNLAIQVKTSRINKPSWILNKKSENIFSENLFYIFVLLSDKSQYPQFYIVPSKEVANYITISHREWLKVKKVNGEKRKDSDMRKFDDPEHKYKDKWNLLNQI